MLASFNHAHLRFGPHEVLKDVTWALQEDECWGVIGRNGAGKSTLFKVLLGHLELDGGSVVRPNRERGIRMGYYSQDLEPETAGNVLEETLAAFGEVEVLQRSMRDYEHQMSEGCSDLHTVMQQYQLAMEAFERLDGFSIRARAEGILFALGFASEMLQKSVHELSGGQKSRVMLAKAILQGQDLLLLDEPTNHLDLPSLRWLESFLNDTTATVAVISHDRYFLDNVATSIFEIEAGRSRVYEGNYTEFIEKKEQELEIAEKHFEQQQAYIRKQEEYIRRNIAGQNTKQARGRRTHLGKLQRLDKPLQDRRKVKFTFTETQRSGDTALVLEGVQVGYEGVPLFEKIEHLQVKRAQKLAIVGFNGTGKSTLLKAIAEEVPFLAGGSRLGSQVKLGYFDQHHKNLDPRNTVFQQIQSVIPFAPKQDVLGFLAKFQFRGDDVDKPVTVLSGGERARLSVATLIREGVNLLLLDEPTNHMDIHSMEAMEDTILSFTGAVVLVTHDRYLLGRVADSLLRIHDGKAEWRSGGYEEHQGWVDLDLGHEPQEEEEGKAKPKSHSKGKGDCRAEQKADISRLETGQPESEPPVKAKAIDKEKQKGLRRLERLVGEAEARVSALEAKAALLNQEILQTDPSDWKSFQEKLEAQKTLETELAYAMADWEEHQQALESLDQT